jgi:hypothetical protein
VDEMRYGYNILVEKKEGQGPSGKLSSMEDNRIYEMHTVLKRKNWNVQDYNFTYSSVRV